MKLGYQLTEVGIIPEDWGAASIGEVATKVGSGITPTGGNRVYKQEGRPFLRSQNVGWSCLFLDDIAFIDEVTHSTFAETEIKIGDIFLNITGASIGRSSIADFRVEGGNVNQHVCIIRTDECLLVPRFLNLILLSSLGQKQIDSFQAGGNRQGLNFSQVRSISIPLPPLSEQRSIAATLSDMDEFLGALDRLIAKKRHLKQAAMQQLLTGKTRLPGFGEGKSYQQTEVGLIPEDWAVVTIREITSLVTNGFVGKATDHYTDKDDGVTYIQGYNVEANSFNFNGIKKVTPAFHKIHQKSCLKKDDLLTIQTGEVGLTTIVPESLVGSNCHALIISRFKKEKVYPWFYAHYFNSPLGRLRLRDLEVGTTMMHINVGELLHWEVPYPRNLTEQREIATILSDMDAEIATLEQRRDKTRALKQAMMQELLTGRIRLV